MSWTAVRVHSMERPEAVMAVLFEHGATGVQEDDGSLLTHFPDSLDTSILRRALTLADAGAQLETSFVGEVNWAEQWRVGVHAHHIGGLTVTPPWLATATDPAHTVIVDPGMAFGTGEHASTRGVLRLMQHVIRANDTVADLGTGSAVLAIAAAKLGAARIAAIELDPEALDNAESNVARNEVVDRIRIIQGDAALLLPLIAPVRVVLANILAPVLLELLPIMRDALTPDGRAILAGMLLDERPTMIHALEHGGWRVADEDIDSSGGMLGPDGEASWWSVVVAPS